MASNWARMIWILILRIYIFWIFWIPDFQTEAWAGLGLAGAPSAAAPRHLRTTKLVRSKELGQYSENPISEFNLEIESCRACAQCVCLVSSGKDSLVGDFPFCLFPGQVFPFPPHPTNLLSSFSRLYVCACRHHTFDILETVLPCSSCFSLG